MITDIRDASDIKRLIDNFYLQAGQDQLLGPIFSRIPASDPGKDALYHYWQAVLLGSSADDTAFPGHMQHMFSRRHFVRWVNLFIDVIDHHFAGPVAERAKVMVIRKSEQFQSKLALSRF